MTLDVVEDVTI